MQTNARLALLLTTLSVAIGYARTFGAGVLGVLSKTTADTLTMVGTMTAAGALVFAIASAVTRTPPGLPELNVDDVEQRQSGRPRVNGVEVARRRHADDE